MRDPAAVLLGSGLNALSAARSLGRAGREVQLLSEVGEGATAERSRWVDGSFRAPCRATVEWDWLDRLQHHVPEGSVVIPCSDRGLQVVARHRRELEGWGLRPAESDDELVLAMLDKQETYRRAAALGVDVPRTALVRGLADALAVAREIGYPLALKPRRSHEYERTARMPKIILVRDDLELAAKLARTAAVELLLTEVVPGPDSGFCSYYGYVDAAGRELLHLTKSKPRQYPAKVGTGTYHVTDWQPDVAALGRRLFQGLGLLGLGNVEFKRDGRDGRLVLIECNLRLTAAVDLLRRAGVDLADVVYQRALGRPVAEITSYRTGMRQWRPLHDLMAQRQYHASGEITTGQWLGSLAHRQQLTVLDVRDPGPSAARLVGAGREALHLAGHDLREWVQRLHPDDRGSPVAPTRRREPTDAA